MSGASDVGAGAGETIITGYEMHRIGRIISNGSSVTMRGITFEQGRHQGPEACGGALLIVDTAVSLSECEFRDNVVRPRGDVAQSDAGGGAVSISLSSPHPVAIRDCVFRRNRVDFSEFPFIAPGYARGGAVLLLADGVPGRIERCVFDRIRRFGSGLARRGQQQSAKQRDPECSQHDARSRRSRGLGDVGSS